MKKILNFSTFIIIIITFLFVPSVFGQTSFSDLAKEEQNKKNKKTENTNRKLDRDDERFEDRGMTFGYDGLHSFADGQNINFWQFAIGFKSPSLIGNTGVYCGGTSEFYSGGNQENEVRKTDSYMFNLGLASDRLRTGGYAGFQKRFFGLSYDSQETDPVKKPESLFVTGGMLDFKTNWLHMQGSVQYVPLINELAYTAKAGLHFTLGRSKDLIHHVGYRDVCVNGCWKRCKREWDSWRYSRTAMGPLLVIQRNPFDKDFFGFGGEMLIYRNYFGLEIGGTINFKTEALSEGGMIPSGGSFSLRIYLDDRTMRLTKRNL